MDHSCVSEEHVFHLLKGHHGDPDFFWLVGGLQAFQQCIFCKGRRGERG